MTRQEGTQIRYSVLTEIQRIYMVTAGDTTYGEIKWGDYRYEHFDGPDSEAKALRYMNNSLTDLEERAEKYRLSIAKVEYTAVAETTVGTN